MSDFRTIEIKQSIFDDNDKQADLLRASLKEKRIFLLNLMSSPGSGKTTTLTRTIQQLKDSCNNFSLELNNKDKMIDHLNYELHLSEDHKDKANTNAAFVETVLLRVCKMFPNTNLYKIVHDINDRFLNDKDK